MLPLILTLSASAESWCAAPLSVHEWGVAVFSAGGDPLPGVPLPDWFHTRHDGSTHSGPAVVTLPPDSGMRALPILQFYTPRVWGDTAIPVGIDVSFPDGAPAAWYPQVDTATDHDLSWRRLDLTHQPPSPPLQPDPVGWVEPLRAVDGALWVKRSQEAERFVFYEGTTHQFPALGLGQGGVAEGHHILHNHSDWDMHDVFLIHVANGQRSFWYTPKIPAGASASALLEVRMDDPAEVLRSQLTTARPAQWSIRDGECIMMRRPDEGTSTATGHRVYAEELSVLLGVWSERFFEADGSRILYREDTAALDALMPLALYTDMYHHVQTSRLGLVLIEDVALQPIAP